MLHLPTPIPAGDSYVRIARSKSATMRLILETVQRGSRYWTGGIIAPDKALRLADKFASLYATDASQSKRSWNKSQGRANSTLIMYPEDDQTLSKLRWWLLVTPGHGLVHQEEQLQDSWNRRQRLTWGEQYELLHLQHSREYGGGRHWTWQMQEQRFTEMTEAMRQLSSGHGNPGWGSGHPAVHLAQPVPQERTDDLAALITAIKRMPGYHGIRMQQMQLYRLGKEIWERTHKHPYTEWPTDVPYVDKRQPVYHRPQALRLDVLVVQFKDYSQIHRRPST